jgi:hypothetical protein
MTEPVVKPSARADLHYRERIGAPWWLWVFMVAMALSAGAVALAGLEPWGVLLTVLLALLAGSALLVSWTGRVDVRDGELRAGRARIPVDLLGTAEALDAERAALVRGREINAAAYHYIRGWAPEGVKVTVEDPADPTPYWYVSTRRPQALAQALTRARTAGQVTDLTSDGPGGAGPGEGPRGPSHRACESPGR